MKKKQHALLINPWIYDFKLYDEWMLPLGLLYIAEILRKNNYQISYINCLQRNHPSLKNKYNPRNRTDGTGQFYSQEVQKPKIYSSIPRKYKQYGIKQDVFLNEIEKTPHPDIILVTSLMTYWYPGPFLAIKLLKKIFPDVPVVLGGIYATTCYPHAIKHSGADHILTGAFNRQHLSFINKLTKNNYPEWFPSNLNNYPEPNDELIGQKFFRPLLTTSGCIYKCTYCATPVLNPKYTERKVENILKLINSYVKEKGIINFAFYDDALLVKQKRFLQLFDSILKNGLNCQFYTPNGIHARFINAEVAERMFLAGFRKIRLGLETTHSRKQKQSGGKITGREFKKAIKNLLNAGFKPNEIGAYVMIGLTDWASILKTIDFVASLGIQIKLVFYSPIPGTTMFRALQKNNRISHLLEEPLAHNDSSFLTLSGLLEGEKLINIKKICHTINDSLAKS